MRKKNNPIVVKYLKFVMSCNKRSFQIYFETEAYFVSVVKIIIFAVVSPSQQML